MTRATAETTIAAYYAAFNAGNTAGMIDTLHDEFVHHVNEGATRMGKAAFAEFCAHMSETYRTNDAFWTGRGYAKLPGVLAEFAWKDVGDAGESVKQLQFWMRGV